MKGDIVLLEEHHKKAASEIISNIIDQIKNKPSRFVITVAGESGSGKSETALAIAQELGKHGIKAIVLGQDDYFHLPPKMNSAKRQEDSDWLGPHMEVNFEVFEQNLMDALQGKSQLTKPLVDYNANTIDLETISLVDVKVFISRNWLKTLEARKKRNRGNEVNDPFTEQILATEHKIIAGHKQLADFIINDEYQVINVETGV